MIRQPSDPKAVYSTAPTPGDTEIVPQFETPSTLTLSSGLVLLLSFALMAVAWFHSFAEIWQTRWFRLWRAYDRPLWDRLTGGDSYYTHGPLVPLTCMVIAIYIYRRVGLPARRCIDATLCGWGLLTVCMLGHFVGVYGRVKFLSGFCFIGTLAALVLLWGGWRLLRAYWVPVLFLVSMIPLPMNTIASLNFKLKFMAVQASVWLTNNFFGIPAILDGSYVHLPSDTTGVPKTLMIENVCGGLRSLIALTFFASLFAVVCRVKGLWRWLMLLMAVPVAIACNVTRITALNVAAHHYDVSVASKGAAFHDLSGLAVFVLALALLFGLEAVIIRCGHWLKRDWSDRRLLPFLASIARHGSQRFVTGRPAVLVVLAVGAALSIYLAGRPVAQHVGKQAGGAIPLILDIDGTPYEGIDLTLDERTLEILETDDYLYRRYMGSDDRAFEVMIVFSTNIRNGVHAPEVCLEGSGQSVIQNELEEFQLDSIGTLQMRKLTTRRNTRQSLHAYAFKCGGAYTTSYLRQQAAIFFNGLLRRNTAGALIRFTVEVDGPEDQQSGQLLHKAIRKIMPDIESSLP